MSAIEVGRSYTMGSQGGGSVLSGAVDGLAAAVWKSHVHPGGGPPPHVHRDRAEAFYVLEGRFRFRLGDDEMELAEGDFVLAPAGVTHGFTNPGPGPGRLLCIAPQESLEEVEALAQLVNSRSGQPDLAAVAELFDRHNSFLVG